MPSFSTTAINSIPKAAVDVAGFYVIQKPAFVLPAIRSIFGIILESILILFLFFKYAVFPYKTPNSEQPMINEELSKSRIEVGAGS